MAEVTWRPSWLTTEPFPGYPRPCLRPGCEGLALSSGTANLCAANGQPPGKPWRDACWERLPFSWRMWYWKLPQGLRKFGRAALVRIMVRWNVTSDETVTMPGCHALHESSTKLALLIQLATGHRVWVPQSVIHDDSEVYQAGHKGKLVVKAWWANKNGLEEP